LLERRYFALSAEALKKFTAMLDKLPKDNPELRRLLETRAPLGTLSADKLSPPESF
jgi:uncharacterized protein (DUF1778 family)